MSADTLSVRSMMSETAGSGWRMPPIPIVHAIDFYYELLKEGRLEITKKYEEPVTLHDPCNVDQGRRPCRKITICGQCDL